MPRTTDAHTLLHVVASPRFEIFYALQALESGAKDSLAEWQGDMERRIPARLRTSIASIAPTPLIWPVLADALRELPAGAGFTEMISGLAKMDTRTFQTFVLGGVFKTPGIVDGLVAGTVSLPRAVADEGRTQQKLLALLGLHPFSRLNPTVVAFSRIVGEPGRYRDEVVEVLELFWTSGFSETWHTLEPELRERANEMRTAVSNNRFAVFARDNKLPITIEGDTILTIRGGVRTAVKSATVYLLPSAFNKSNLWAAYADARGRTRFFIPIFDPGISPAAAATIEPALIFRALGDTTRYAIASSIARSPMTSVELARVFNVSKPTISHHVQLLRSAGLLEETAAENGVVLALNRRVLERASAAAAREMFSQESSDVVKRTRRPAS